MSVIRVLVRILICGVFMALLALSFSLWSGGTGTWRGLVYRLYTSSISVVLARFHYVY